MGVMPGVGRKDKVMVDDLTGHGGRCGAWETVFPDSNRTFSPEPVSLVLNSRPWLLMVKLRS